MYLCITVSEPNENNKKHKNIYIEHTTYTQAAYITLD
jgi:hypothetical protein